MNNNRKNVVDIEEALNSTLEECTNIIRKKLIPVKVNRLNGVKTIKCDNDVYNVSIEIKILKG